MGDVAAAGTESHPLAALILEVDIRRKSFGTGAAERLVLDQMVFTLGDREIVALVGPSGCGKTTLLRIVGGLDTQFDGEVRWRAGRSPRIGMIFQEPRLLPWRTVRQNLLLAVSPEKAGVADELLRTLGLWPFRDAYPRKISLGMARRAAIARAFAITPDLVLMDEPFVSLDPAMAERGREVLLDAWRRRPTSALLVTHDPMDAAALADRVLMLSTSPARIVDEVEIEPRLRRSGPETSMRIAMQLHAARAAAS
jgi:ABC-type nitrate/sulfonate/bicarbonate transport system ATPase subunit